MLNHRAILMPLMLLSITITSFSFTSRKAEYSSYMTCNVKEKQALLRIKKKLVDPTNWLSSWSVSNQQDCCKWVGIRCNNSTGQVTQLLLGNTYHYPHPILGGQISSSLLELKFLSYLDFSSNYFNLIQIPSFLGSLRSLTHLNLNDAGFSGLIPHQLGNLSNLHYLNLGNNWDLQANNLHWASNLLPLEYLELNQVYFHSELNNWLQVFSTLPSSIKELHLRGCTTQSMVVPPQGYANISKFTTLRVFHLSENQLNGEFMHMLFNLTSLELLDLHRNSLQGEMPQTILNFRNLRELYLNGNELIGQIPESLGRLRKREYLYLGDNSLTGLIPTSLGNLSSLRVLHLGENKLNGTLPRSLGILSNLLNLIVWHNLLEGDEARFSKLSKLKILDMSFTNMFLNVSSSWVPPFQLTHLFMDSCKMGPKFPLWLQTQNSLEMLWISNSGIVDIAPSWFWNWTLQVQFLDIARNQTSGDISGILLKSYFINLSSNRLKGKLPQLTSNVIVLRVANNSISGPISTFQFERMSIGYKLQVLGVSNNFLSGELGDCWKNLESLSHLNLGRNNLSGKIPDSIGYLHKLQSLHLQLNRFSGYIPSSLKNCLQLGFLDAGEINFPGLYHIGCGK